MDRLIFSCDPGAELSQARADDMGGAWLAGERHVLNLPAGVHATLLTETAILTLCHHDPGESDPESFQRPTTNGT